MNQDFTDSGETTDSGRPPAARRSRALVAAAGLALLASGLAACGADRTSSARSVRAPDDVAMVTTTVSPGGAVTTHPLATIAVPAECRKETAPLGIDAYGIRHTGEGICTWGADMRSRLDSNGFLIPSQNHPVDVVMAARCWSAAGRVYLRTPASEGWACIGGSPVSTTPVTPPTLSVSSVLTLRGLGPVRIGMTMGEASAAAGTTLVPRAGPTETCVYATPDGGPTGTSFMFLSGRLARVEVTVAGIKTQSGAGVGDSEAHVQGLYSGQLQVSPHKYVAAGRYLTLLPSDAADADLRLIFETDGSRVTRFRAGVQPGVSYVEGCA